MTQITLRLYVRFSEWGSKMSAVAGASLIRAGAAALADWRALNPRGTIVASASEFRDLTLSGANFVGVDFENSAFQDCNLANANFSDANLKAVQFINCNLSGAIFAKAELKSAVFDRVDLSRATFVGSRSLPALKRLTLKSPTALAAAPEYDRDQPTMIARYLGWDRLRFLSRIRIFVPAYASLAVSLLYLNSISWYNEFITTINAVIPIEAKPLLPSEATWNHVAVVVNFLLLSIASTAFLACPARILEFSRERWVSELSQPELLYDCSAWSNPLLRSICALTLFLGGVLSSFLLGRAILSNVTFMMTRLM